MNRHPKPPDEATVKRLQTLLERRKRADHAASEAADRLYVAAFNACEVEPKASREEVAKALGVGKSTVQGWVNRGRQLRSPDRGT